GRTAYSTLCRVTAGADVTGHVRAVPVAVVRVVVRLRLRLVRRAGGIGVVVVPDEVIPLGHPLGREARPLSAATQVRVVVVHTGVQDAHLDTFTGVSELALHDVRTGHRQCADHLRSGGGGLLRR